MFDKCIAFEALCSRIQVSSHKSPKLEESFPNMPVQKWPVSADKNQANELVTDRPKKAMSKIGRADINGWAVFFDYRLKKLTGLVQLVK